MTEAIFPVIGAAFVFLAVLPACALLAKLALLLVERWTPDGALHGLNVRFVLVTASSALPLAWFLSAGLHQVEASASSLACLFDHETAARCFEPAAFSLVIMGAVIALGIATLRWHRQPKPCHGEAARALCRRMTRLLIAYPALAPLRLAANDDANFTIATYGVIKQVVVVGLAFADRLTDAQLVSALAHEAEHVRTRDPSRYLMLSLSLAINPLGRRLLAPHVTRWIAAREVQCDRFAIARGTASPLCLAEAIIHAARAVRQPLVALGRGSTSLIKFRIGMLVAFAEHAPTQRRHERQWSLGIAAALVAVALLLPHHAGTTALDAVHTTAEAALHSLFS